MVANISSKLEKEKEKIELRLGPSVKRKRMTSPRRRLSCGQGRDFFRLAAAFAHPDTKEIQLTEHTDAAPKEGLHDLTYSKYLQARYQERSALFSPKSDTALLADEKMSFVQSVLEKWRRAMGGLDKTIETLFIQEVDQAYFSRRSILPADSVQKNGISFNAHEMSLLLSIAEGQMIKAYLKGERKRTPSSASHLTALDFHLRFKALIDEKSPRPFVLVMNSNKREHRLLVETARLFWSHRLKIKSLQASDAAESSICYFHAALKSSKGLKNRFDVLYWLKMDEEKAPQGGEFIEFNQGTAYPKELIFPHTLLFEPVHVKECLEALDSPTRAFIEAVKELLVTH